LPQHSNAVKQVPSPLRGERVRVRGERHPRLRSCEKIQKFAEFEKIHLGNQELTKQNFAKT
jgi:hypothetical protein